MVLEISCLYLSHFIPNISLITNLYSPVFSHACRSNITLIIDSKHYSCLPHNHKQKHYYFMEPRTKNVAILSIEPNETIDQIIFPSHDHETNKSFQPYLKKNGSKNIFKVALFMMRRHSPKSKHLPVHDESRTKWRKFVGSVRPLHLQRSQSLLEKPQTPNKMQSLSEIATEDGFDSIPNSPILRSPSSSLYALAIWLNKLVEDEESQNEKSGEEIAKDGGAGGDDMIDAKAEEFIAEFYLQMKLQQFKAMDHHYREISQRSLGL